jgi:hypothetical protein
VCDKSGRRLTSQVVESLFGNFTLNNQDALKYGHVKHPNSLSEREFGALLDQFAFFWPGSEHGPIKMGRNFANYDLHRGKLLIQVTVSTVSFLTVNNRFRVFVSTCNSGGPRSNPTRKIYRGFDTFVPMLKYDGLVSEVKEVAVLGYARLPEFVISELIETI